MISERGVSSKYKLIKSKNDQGVFVAIKHDDLEYNLQYCIENYIYIGKGRDKVVVITTIKAPPTIKLW